MQIMSYLLCQISLAQNGKSSFAFEAKTVLAWSFGEDCSSLAIMRKLMLVLPLRLMHGD